MFVKNIYVTTFDGNYPKCKRDRWRIFRRRILTISGSSCDSSSRGSLLSYGHDHGNATTFTSDREASFIGEQRRRRTFLVTSDSCRPQEKSFVASLFGAT